MGMVGADLAFALDPVLLAKKTGLDPDPWQEDLLRSDAQQMLLLCARQSGKSTVTSRIALHSALYQAPALILALSPSQRQSQELFRKVKLALGYRPLIPVKEESALRLEFVNGSRILALPGSEETVRGFSGVSLLLVDEAARVSDLFYQAIRPMLAVSGGRLIGLTTPWGRRGWFYQEWTEGGDDWLRVKRTAYDCPRITREWLEKERRSLPDFIFRQEYLCEFVDTTDQYFATEHVMGALDPNLAPLFGGTPCVT